MRMIDKSDRKDADFISGVWQKVRYLEYIKHEEEIVKKNNKKLLIKQLKIGTYLFAAAQFILLPVLLVSRFNMFSIIIIGIVALSGSILFDYIENVSIHRGLKYED